MQFSVVGERDPFLLVSLEQGEAVFAESGAMVSMATTLDLKGEVRGGLLSAVARKLTAGETLFTQRVEGARGSGEVLLAPALPGDVQILEVGALQYVLNDGAFLAAETSVELRMKAQGIGQALWGGTGGFFVVQTAGRGKLAVGGFGSLFSLTVERGSDLIIDNQHVIAWDSRLDYTLSTRTVGGGGFFSNLINSQTSGEGLVTRFTGEGKVLVSSRNRDAFTSYLRSQIVPPSQ